MDSLLIFQVHSSERDPIKRCCPAPGAAAHRHHAQRGHHL